MPAAWVLLNLVTVRWEIRIPGESIPPQWGFPIPWAEWNGVSSMEWRVAVSGALANLLFYGVLIVASFEIIRREMKPVSSGLRRFGIVLLVVATAYVSLDWIMGLMLFNYEVVWLLKSSGVVPARVCVLGDCYQQI